MAYNETECNVKLVQQHSENSMHLSNYSSQYHTQSFPVIQMNFETLIKSQQSAWTIALKNTKKPQLCPATGAQNAMPSEQLTLMCQYSKLLSTSSFILTDSKKISMDEFLKLMIPLSILWKI